MKTKLLSAYIVLALFDGIHQAAATGTTVFPIETNPAVIAYCYGVAFDGTNYLVEGLTGTNSSAVTNVNVQLVSASGTLIGSPINIGGGVSFNNAGGLGLAFGQTNYLVAWSDTTISSGVDLFGQLISRTGAEIGPAFDLLAFQGSHGFQTVKALASDGTNFLTVWQDGNDNNLYGQLVTPAGTLSGSPLLISSQLAGATSVATAFGKTNYLVVAQSNIGGGGNANQVYGAFVSSSGAIGNSFQISQTASTDYNFLAVAFDGTNYFAVWNLDTGPETGMTVTNWQIYGRLVSQTGTFPGSELALITNGNNPVPSLAFDGANYLLTYGLDSNTTNSDRNMYCRFLDRSGNLVGSRFIPLAPQGTNIPAIALNGTLFNGNKFVIAATLGTFGVNGEIFAASIPASTTPPTLAPAGPLAGTQFPLQLAGTPGIDYAIQFSTNLALPNWTAFATNSPTNGTFSFTDTRATNKSRFYRAVKQ